jgi:bacterioferritin-associated ferredoxin
VREPTGRAAKPSPLIKIKSRREQIWLRRPGNDPQAAAMIVCSCHVISDNEVEAAFSAPEAPQTMSQIYRHLGHEPQCGRCVRTIRDLMRQDGRRRSRRATAALALAD